MSVRIGGKIVAGGVSKDGLAKTDFSNITNESRNVVNWSTNATNCLKEMCKNINLELNNGTLTLKAERKVCAPNGVGKFDTVTSTNDISTSESPYQYTGKVFVMVNANATAVFTERSEIISSGSSPGYHDQYGTWYDTTNNKIKRTTDNGVTWNGDFAFPIAICNYNNGIISIDQVFNTVGYIGSTAFALPNITILIPNYRNADGSLNNLELVTDKVSISEIPEKETTYHVFLDQLGNLGFWETDSTYTNYYPTPTTGKNWLVYDEDLNVYRESNNGGKYYDKFICIIGTLSNKKVKSFKIKNVLRFVDYSDYDTLFDNRIRVVSTPPVEAEANTYYYVTE